jgi:hypothetical protein
MIEERARLRASELEGSGDEAGWRADRELIGRSVQPNAKAAACRLYSSLSLPIVTGEELR